MKHVTQPVGARGTMLSAVAVVAALAAVLVLAPFASATSDPVASGTTTLTLKKGFYKNLKKKKVKVLKWGSGKVNKRKVTLSVSGGSMDPTNGLGSLELGGGFKFKRGKRTAPITNLVLDSAQSSLAGKVAGKQMRFAKVANLSYARNGFGVNVNLTKVQLTGNAVKQLNKKLGYTKSKKNKKNKRASASKEKSDKNAKSPFKKNQVMSGAYSESQPKTVAVIATGNARLSLSAESLVKLASVGGGLFPVELSIIPPTSIVSLGPPPVVDFPIGGGNVAPDANAGILETNGGLKLIQDLELVAGGVTTLTMANIWIDLSAKTATVEVSIENPVTAAANLGNLGRSSIADIQLTGATITSDPNTRTVSVQNASATLQAVTAETLNAVFVEPIEGEGNGIFAGGDPLGTFSFTAQTQ